MDARAEPRPLLIDTDPGVDDAWAILLAAASASHRIIGLSIVGGNVGLAQTCRNACHLVDLLQARIPVYPGAAFPLIGGIGDAAHVHGRDGLGDADLPEPVQQPDATGAVAAILQASREHTGVLDILALGPLTNLALALRLDPGLPQRVHRLVVMGGALDGVGNITAEAEFNFAFDPEAAEIILRDWPGVELVDWSEVLRVAPLLTEVDQWLAAQTPRSRWMHRVTRAVRDFLCGQQADRWALADPLAAHVLVSPQWARQSERSVRVELCGPARGASRPGPLQAGRAAVRVIEADRAPFLQAVAAALGAGV